MAVSSTETLLLNKLFSVALEKRATDIHLMAGNYPVLRLDNKLYVMADEAILTVDFLQSVVDGLLSEEERARLQSEKDVKIVYTWADRARFRASVFYQRGYPALSFRLIPQEIPDPKQLLIPDSVIAKIGQQQGLIIISGPFNSGRTTTMASLLQYINVNSTKRISTLERPIEYLLVNSKSLVNQRQVGTDTPSYVHGITDALDEDVDVIAVGELSEPGIFELVLTAAESGKIVLGIMDANSSISAVEKFIGSISKEQRHWAKDSFSTMLGAVINQRLVPSVGGGRVLAVEILTMSPAVASVIQEEKYPQLANVLTTSRDEGMMSLDFRLQELVKQGKVAADEARKFALDPSTIH